MHVGQGLTGLAWTPHVVPVDVYVNGEYRGIFHLAETVEIGPDRVDIDALANTTTSPATDWNAAPTVTGGYLLQWGPTAEGDHTVSVNARGTVAIAEPGLATDGTGITQAQLEYITGYLQAADAAIDSPDLANPETGWRRYLDEESAVDYYLAQEYLKEIDGRVSTSVYMYKERDSAQGPGKLHLGPLWDYDMAMGDVAFPGATDAAQGWYLAAGEVTRTREVSAEVGTWWTALNQDETFRAAVAARWQELQPLFAGLPQYIDEQAAVISPATGANFERWSLTEPVREGHRVQGSWEGEVAFLKDWTTARTDWLNRQWGP